MESLILVDSNDNAIGEISKMEAHERGLLHRAFSVFVFTSDGKWLLQKRAPHKYHSGNRWSNSCCGHPVTGEDTLTAAGNRLKFEMGISCDLKNIFDFTYRAEFNNGLTEHEYDHVYIGISDAAPSANPEEVVEWKYLSFSGLKKEINQKPSDFTEWLKMIYERVNDYMVSKKNSKFK